MGFLQVTSTNHDLSYIIGKNPSGGMQSKKCKKGIFYNYYSNDGKTYNIYFKDKVSEISYPQHPDAAFEYGNTAKYNNPRVYCDMFSDLLNDARIKPREHDVEGFCNSVKINLIYTQFKTIDIFKRYFTPLGVLFDYSEVVEGTNNFSVSISTTKKINYLFSVANLFSMVASLNSDDYIYLTDDFVEKYIDMANFIDAPYFIKYLIKIRLLRSPNRFQKLLTKLNTSNSHTFEFLFGDTHDARIEFVKSHVFGTKSILDIGSGIDFRYVKTFAKTVKDNKKTYHAVDTDPNAQIKVTKYFERENMDENNIVYSDLSDAIFSISEITNENFDVLCTEVLEHNEIPQAQTIIKNVLAHININKFILTVPNSEFNQFYLIDGFRHEDHKWEVSFNEFKNIVLECIDSNKFDIEFYQVGDKVNGISTSSGCIIKPKK